VKAGFAGRKVFAPGDWNGQFSDGSQGWPDILSVDARGDMYLHRGSVDTLGQPTKIGNGWSGYRVIPAGDLTGDESNDLLAIDTAGNLKLYAGTGSGGFKYPYLKVGNGWNGYDLYAAGDVTKDGKADILSVDSSGRLWLYAGRGDGRFLTKKQVGNGWGTYTLAAGADLTGDGISDIVGRDDKTRTLYLYKGRGSGLFMTKVAIATGW
jgi:hypothetical protein